jgi:hypothetical protein
MGGLTVKRRSASSPPELASVAPEEITQGHPLRSRLVLLVKWITLS